MDKVQHILSVEFVEAVNAKGLQIKYITGASDLTIEVDPKNTYFDLIDNNKPGISAVVNSTMSSWRISNLTYKDYMTEYRVFVNGTRWILQLRLAATEEYTASSSANVYQTRIESGSGENKMAKYVGSNALLYVTNKLKALIGNKVDKVDGKGLSTNDLTDELKAKILAAGDSSFSGDYNDLTNKPTIPTTESINTAITNATNGLASEEYVNNKITAVYRYKGSVANKAALPTADQVVGDTYNLEDTGMNVAWNGTGWDDLGAIIDLTGYVKESDLVEVTNAEIDAMFTE